ncbi:hypothetical protein [Mycolicibacterium parafortuitum]|uniref:Uncharacterized protein n=1 Tax=Mycolicibacterium parafortuitum TaxID=39692 RepID=A0A375YD55_MYCPF|nr:hypothetical protein [Mycolicibacterium parafortuitum]ORB31010.1 hypothetical protein BST38_06750 [Mycolicibacterium parafortuitum]SRX79024.1 hypothetical protein MPP7335_00757 [Mycolicibacterium parafortuitum]
MNTVLYFSPSGAVYETRAYTEADINRLIQDQGLYSLSSTDRQFDFWFSPATQGCQRRVNRLATEVLLATTDFTAKSVPLLRGCVVVATHDSDGDLDGLSWQQLALLSEKAATLSKRDDRVLSRRIAGDERRRTREIAPAAAVPAGVTCARPQAGLNRRGSSHAPSLNR